MELDLSFNHTGDAGVKTLSQILKNPNCALQKFKFVSGHTTQLLCSVLKHLNIKDKLNVFFHRLEGCGLTEESGRSLAEALSRNSSLVDLDLSKNPLMDSGLRFLCDGLKSPSCKLETLRYLHLLYFYCLLFVLKTHC